MMKTLHISSDLSLPLDFVTKTIAILAQRRKGKTYTASVLAEELVAAKIPTVVLDPTGAWWGLRASADGKSAGLPVVILGGQHADLPLERTAGKFIADLVIEHPSYYVIDFSLFESAEAERQFATDFAERLYRLKAHAAMDFPMHLIIDEADRFIPQRVPSGDTRMLGAFETIVRRGGLRGLGTTVISQRAAVVNKNVLEQIDTLIILRVVGPNDQRAIEDYVKAKGTAEEKQELMDSMASLKLGEAWVWEPGSEPYIFQRIQVRKRRTYNSSATPKAGEKRIEPKRMAAVDLEAIKLRMAETIERAKAEDPRELRRQIAELKRQVNVKASVKAAGKPIGLHTVVDNTKLIEREVQRALADRDREWLSKLRPLEAEAKASRNVLTKIVGLIGGVTATEVKGKVELPKRVSAPVASVVSISRPRPVTEPFHRPATRPAPAAHSDNGTKLRPGAVRMLAACAQWHPNGIREGQVAAQAGVKRSGGSFSSYKSNLVTSGLLRTENGLYYATDAGLEFLGDNVNPAPSSTEEVVALWRPKLRPGAQRMLDVLIQRGGEPMAVEELSAESGVSAEGGSFSSYLSNLATADLVVKPQRGMVAANREALFL